LPPGALARIGTVRFRTGNSVMTVRFSPDGRELVSMDHDAVVFWDPRTGKELRRRKSTPAFYRGHYSPDGKKLWMQTFEDAMSVWDLTAPPDRGPVPLPFRGPHTRFIQPFPDGKLLATGNKDSIRIWDIATTKVVRELNHEEEVDRVALSADGTRLASHGRGPVYLWDVQAGKLVSSFPPNPVKDDSGRFRNEDSVTGFALSADGKRVATSFYGKNGPLRIWDVTRGKEIHNVAGSDYSMRAMQFSPDGLVLAVASQNSLRMWDVTTGKVQWQIPVLGNQPFDITFSPDGTTLAVGLVFMIRLWDVATGRELCPIPEHRAGVGFVWLSPDGRTVITAGQATGGVPGSGNPGPDAPSLRYWDATSGRQLVGQEQHLLPLADLSADGKVLASWGKDKKVEIVEAIAGKPISQVPYEDEVTICELSPDGRVLLLGNRIENKGVSINDRDIKLQLWDVHTGKALGKLEGHKGMLWGGGSFSADGKQLATLGFQDKTVRVWDVASRREVYQFQPGEQWVWRVVFSPDGRTLTGAGLSLPIRRWDMATGKELTPLTNKVLEEKHESGVHAVAYLPDGKTLITTDNFGKVFLWDVATGNLRREWQAHKFRVSFLAVSANGKILLTKGASAALVWDIEGLLEKKP